MMHKVINYLFTVIFSRSILEVFINGQIWLPPPPLVFGQSWASPSGGVLFLNKYLANSKVQFYFSSSFFAFRPKLHIYTTHLLALLAIFKAWFYLERRNTVTIQCLNLPVYKKSTIQCLKLPVYKKSHLSLFNNGSSLLITYITGLLGQVGKFAFFPNQQHNLLLTLTRHINFISNNV